MEVTKPPVGIRTRARAMTADNSGDVKRRKLDNASSTFVQTEAINCESHDQSVLMKENPNDCCRSCYSTATESSMEELKVISDLQEVESTGAKDSSIGMNKSSLPTLLPPEKMPPESELEEFFAAAQENINKRFKNKYNYDILNDIPLEGRFEWIQVKPLIKVTMGNDDD
ncbi:hypothetical protein R6Q59_008239 [Mikania micrantha]